MTVLGIHATGQDIAEQILASTFRPGTSLANYLGEGAYFYLVHGDRGYQNAIECAETVARRHHRNIAFLVAAIRTDNALNLQNPVIRPLFSAFGATFDRRLSHLGVHVEPNDNASYYRPVSYLTIEVFRRCIEAVSGHAFDVLSARFALKSRDIDIELPHEICVKRSRAIVSVARCHSTDRSVPASSDPATWPCSDSTEAAAQQAVSLINKMDDRDFLDLIVSVYQGSDGCWDIPQSRFANFGPILFLHDSRNHPRAPEIARLIENAGRAEKREIRSVDLATLALTSTPRAQGIIRGLVEKAGGIAALLTPADAEVVSLLMTFAERRPEMPILALLASSPNSELLSEVKAPIVMRSRHNVCCLTLPGTEVLGEILNGFLHDRWLDALAILDIESKMAARHGSPEARHRDARKIVEAYHARKHGLI